MSALAATSAEGLGPKEDPTSSVAESSRSLDAERTKVFMLFQKFDADADGFLNFEEFRRMDAATEENPQEYTEETHAQVLELLQAAKPEQGLSLEDLAFMYLGAGAEMFGTDLNADFATVFPEEARIALIFDAFDADYDGYWSHSDIDFFLQSAERFDEEFTPIATKYLASMIEDGVPGLSLTSLLELYLTSSGDVKATAGEEDAAAVEADAAALSLRAVFQVGLDDDFELAGAVVMDADGRNDRSEVGGGSGSGGSDSDGAARKST